MEMEIKVTKVGKEYRVAKVHKEIKAGRER